MILFFSCKSQNQQKDIPKRNPQVKTAVVFPFTHQYSINCRPGDEKNALIALNFLKKYEKGDLKSCVNDFADSVEFIGDDFQFKGTRDSLLSIFADGRKDMYSLVVDFDSWTTTYYVDRNETWVTLRYLEYWTTKDVDKGEIYTKLFYTDDLMLKNGKIVIYDEKIRRFPDPKIKIKKTVAINPWFLAS